MKNNRRNQKSEIMTDLSTESFDGQPCDAFDMVNTYGTYDIQATADTDNTFPTIAQGTPKSTRRKRTEK